MKIFLSGGSGFIGRNIIEQLGHTHTILAPTHDELDLTDSEAVLAYFKKNPVDVVIHAANIGGTRKQQNVFGITHINLKMFFNLVRAKPYYNRLVTLGSGAEYGKQRPIQQVAESYFDTYVPSDEYGLYKYVCSKFAQNVDWITHLRLFAVFGKYEDYELRFISNAICKALLGQPITMRQNVQFDYLFIDDFIQILERIIEHTPSETFINVGRGEPIDLKTLAEKVIAEVGVNVPVLVSNTGWGNEYTCTTARLREVVPGITYTPIELAIAKLAAYYKLILPTLDAHAFSRDI